MKYLSLPKTLIPGNCFVHIRSTLVLFKKKKKKMNTNVFSLFLLILQNKVGFMWDIYFFIPRDSRCLKPN